MPTLYPQIIDLIDSYLERLTAARSLLAEVGSARRKSKPTSPRNSSPKRSPASRPSRSPGRTSKASFVDRLPVQTGSSSLAEAVHWTSSTSSASTGSIAGPAKQKRQGRPRTPRSFNPEAQRPVKPVMIRTALSANVPSRPVFVPAEQLQVKGPMQARGDLVASNLRGSERSPLLTPEFLAHRWLDNAAPIRYEKRVPMRR